MNTLMIGAVVAAVVTAAVRLRPRRVRADHLDTPRRPQRVNTWSARWRRRRVLAHPPAARAVAEWCDDLARHARSGSTLRDAITSCSPTDPAIEYALRPLQLSIERGSSVADAIPRVVTPGAHLQLALSVVGTAARLGGPSSAAIDRTAMALRRRAAEADDRTTQAAQARLSTHVMTALPLLMLAVLIATDADVRAVTVSPLGAGCIAAGLALNLTGWWWMRRIVGAPT